MSDGVQIFLAIFFIFVIIASIIQYYRKKGKNKITKNESKNHNFFNFDFNDYNKSKANQSNYSASEEIHDFIDDEITRICNQGDSFADSLKNLSTTNHEKYQNEILKILKTFDLDYTIFEMCFFACCDFNATTLEERAWYAISTTLDKKKEFGYVKLEMLKITVLIENKLFYVLFLLANNEKEFYLLFADTNYNLVQRLNIFLRNKIIYRNINNLDHEDLLNKEFIQKEKNIYKSNKRTYFDYLNNDSYFEQENDYDYESEFDFDSFYFNEDEWDEFLNKKQKSYKNNNEKDYHAILGVSKNATEQEIKIAFRKKAKEWHPDVCKKENAEIMFKDINEAYNNLINKKSK
ncbi:MAG: DnaJ domain-containing protein [Malacoplasma sp.]|nr:DnaJ domain-containing protein [Malacoplasma sp.]